MENMFLKQKTVKKMTVFYTFANFFTVWFNRLHLDCRTFNCHPFGVL